MLAIPTEHLLLVGRNNAIHTLLTFDGFNAHQGIARVSRISRPQDKVLDACIVATIIEICLVERTADKVTLGREGLNAPILTTVQGILLLGTNTSAIVAVVVVTKYHIRLLNITETIGAVHIATESLSLLDDNTFLQCLEGSLVGWHSTVLAGSNLLQSPFLQLVTTVHLTILHALVTHAQSTLLEWVDETP